MKLAQKYERWKKGGTPSGDDDGQLVDGEKKRNDITGRLFSHPKIDALPSYTLVSSKMVTSKNINKK